MPTDFNAIEQYVEQALGRNHIDALAKLIEFYQYANLTGLPQWHTDLMLARQLDTVILEEQQLFAQNRISSDQRYEWRNNLIIGMIAGEWVFGSNQNDLIHGDAGNDELYGANNDDFIDAGRSSDFTIGDSQVSAEHLRKIAELSDIAVNVKLIEDYRPK